jgi:hypothetical protein
MHSSHLSNESQYPCDEHITETTQLKELSANLCPQKCNTEVVLYITLSSGPFYFLNFIISSFSEYQVILILAVAMKPDATFEF